VQTIPELITWGKGDDSDVADETGAHVQTLALAISSLIPSFKRLKDCNLATYDLVGDRLGPVEVVEVGDVVCLVGHVQDYAGHWYIVDRTSVVGRIDFVNSLMDPN
jgi:hypothetical protein